MQDILLHTLGLIDRGTRAAGAAALARDAGARAVFALVREPQRGALVPAPGFPPTLPDRRLWRPLLEACRSPGIHEGDVPTTPHGHSEPALACASHGVALVFVGPGLNRAAVEQVHAVLPAVGSAFGAEQEAHVTRGTLKAARQDARDAEELALALDRARGELEDKARSIDQALSRAEEATRAKDRFLAMLGHELRNPLAPIVTALHLMRMRGAQSHEQDVIERHVAHLRMLVDDLLDVARVTQGKIELHRETVEASQVAARAVEMVSPLLEQRRQRLVVDVPSAGLAIDADAQRLAQALANMLTNASRYSPHGTEIRLSARVEDGLVVMRIRDQGIGIEPDALERVFDTFVQGRRGPDGAARGLGIGLAVVRSIVALHGGRVRATSAGRDRGAELIVELPAATRQTVPAPAAPTNDLTTPAERLRVLVVDDNADGLDMLAYALTTMGYDVRTAPDGPRALECARQFHPEIALLDIGLPVMDGYELGRRLVSDRTNGVPRLVAITGYGQDVDRERSRAAGFEAHLVKPVDLDLLRQVLDRTRAEARESR